MRIAVLVAGLVGAALLPGGPLGIGVPVVAVLIAVAVAMTARPCLDTLLFGALALALTSMAALRDSGWLVAVDLVVAWIAAAAAVAGPRLSAILVPVWDALEAPSLVPSPPGNSAQVIRGALFGGLLVVPFGVLFWTADAAFAELGGRVPAPSFDSLLIRAVTLLVVMLAAVGLALAARERPRLATWRRTERLSPWEWALPLAALDALFLAFVTVQLVVLFGGHDHVLETAGLTYAEYAHQGFGQLVVAAVLTLVVIGLAVRHAETPRRVHRLLLRGLLGLLCVLTLVVVASVLQRLSVYEEALGLTRLRLWVDAFTLWLGALFVLILAAGLVASVRRQLPRIVLAGTAIGLLAFSLANPDALVAQRNVERWRETAKLDVWYLTELSADAAPELAELPPSLREDALSGLEERLADSEPLGSWNLARSRARDLLD